MRVGQMRIELYRETRVLNARSQRAEIRRARGPAVFVGNPLGGRESGVGTGESRIDVDRAREVQDRGGNSVDIEALDFEPALDVSAIGVKVAGLARTGAAIDRFERDVQLARE